MKKLFLAIYLLPFLAFSQATYPLQLKANGVIGNFPNFFIANSNLLNAAVKSGGATNAVKVIQQDGTDVVNPALTINFVGGTNFSVGDAGSGVATVTIPTNAAGSIDWSFTNNLATTNWVSTNFVLQSGLVSSNFVTSANLGSLNYVSYSQLSGSNFLSSSQVASSNFVTAAITNGLAGTNQIVRIIAGTNVVIVTNLNDITINSIGGSGTVTKVSSRAGTGILITGDTSITTAGTNTIEVDTGVIMPKSGGAFSGNISFVDDGDYSSLGGFILPRRTNQLNGIGGEMWYNQLLDCHIAYDSDGNKRFVYDTSLSNELAGISIVLTNSNSLSLYSLGTSAASDYRRFIAKSSGTGFVLGSETAGTGIGSGRVDFQTQGTNRLSILENGTITLNSSSVIVSNNIAFAVNTNTVGTNLVFYIDMSKGMQRYLITNSASLTFHTTNRAPGLTTFVKIKQISAASLYYKFNPGWSNFVGSPPPTALSSNVWATLSLSCDGTEETDILAGYAVQPY